MSFASNIRAQRESIGLSVQDVAKVLHVTKGAVQNWERDRENKAGKRKYPKREHLMKLASLYDLPIETLYGWVDEDGQRLEVRPSV